MCGPIADSIEKPAERFWETADIRYSESTAQLTIKTTRQRIVDPFHHGRAFDHFLEAVRCGSPE